jgi:transketolase
MLHQGFSSPLTPELERDLERRAHDARGQVLTATTLAASGHPGGSMSSMELYMTLYCCARLCPEDARWPERDRIVVSHGHTSPGVYAALASAGFFPAEEFVAHFRQARSPFEGHVERAVPGVEWSTGNLGQGLSAAVGMALGARMTGGGWHTFCVMSDGEQHKGQVAEARRLAVAKGLADLTVLVDLNGVQISGHTRDVLPVNVAQDFAADGWKVVEIDGHSISAIYGAIADAVVDTSGPIAIVAHTVIGKGVSFMEDEPEFHGRGLTADEYDRAMAELGLDSSQLEQATARRSRPVEVAAIEHRTPAVGISAGTPRTYTAAEKTDNRSAWGSALVDLADANPDVHFAVLDCDLAESVKTKVFAARYPGSFVECGVGEHNAAVVGGALSTCGVLTFWSDFGVFGIDEVYNQQRLNDINGAGLKLVVTHCGLDVGEDGKTHQCLDYVGALRDFFGWKVVVPADPNQTDRAIRVVAGMEGNVAVAMGRSKLPVITAEDGSPLFGGDYEFRYGDVVWARRGSAAAIVTMGTVAGAALAASDRLRSEGVDVGVAIAASPLHLDDAGMAPAANVPVVFTVEDHGVRTGLGASVLEWLAEKSSGVRVVRLGVDSYQSSGAAAELLGGVGLDTEGIAARIRSALAS